MSEQMTMPALDRQLVDAIETHVVAGNEGSIGKALPNGLQAPPRLRWDPELERIEDPQLARLHTYWSDLGRNGGLPRSSQADLLDLQTQAPYAMLLDVREDGWDFRYRYYGSGIAERSGFDLTGLSVWEIPSTPEISIFFTACYRAVLHHRIPLMTWHVAPPQRTVVSWDRLILPLTDEAGGAISRLLVGNIPGAWRRVRD